MEQDSESIHDPKKCGGPGICLPCSTVDVVNVFKAIVLTQANIPIIAQTLHVSEWASAFIVGDPAAAPAYLVITPRDIPVRMLSYEFRQTYQFVGEENPYDFGEVERR